MRGLRVAALCALAGLGCRPKAQPVGSPTLEEIKVRVEAVDPTSLPVPTATELVALSREVVGQLPDGPRVGAPAPGAPAARLLLKLSLAYRAAQAPSAIAPAGPGTLTALVRVELEPKGEGPMLRVERDLQVDKEGLGAQPTAPEIRAHLRRAIELGAGGVLAAERLWLGPAAPIRAALASTDEALRDDAIRFVAERRDREAVPALLALLKREDPELRDRAIGALAEIGDPRAVKPLAELAKFGDLDELPKIIDAISRVGGSEASAYLEFVAAGNPNPEMRALARRGLEHLQAR